MATVWIPSLMRDLAGGRQTVTVDGSTVRQVVRDLEAQFPGIAARLCEDAEEGELSPHVNVAVDGVVSNLGMLEPVGPESEVHFLPAVSGGAC
jgi:molybdopterin synthase sulfur carrier subunit